MAKSLILVMGCLWVTCVVTQSDETSAKEVPYQPRLSNSKNGAVHDFPLGVLSATGRLVDGENSILVMHIGADGAADRGGLAVGDRIVSIRGKQPAPFSKSTDSGLEGPQTELAMKGFNGVGKRALKGLRGHSSFISIRKKPYLVARALVSSRRKSRFVLTHQYLHENNFIGDMPADSLESGNPVFGPLGIEVET